MTEQFLSVHGRIQGAQSYREMELPGIDRKGHMLRNIFTKQ